MSTWAKPGAKCVCIRTAPPAVTATFPGIRSPLVGLVYTVRAAPIVSNGPNAGRHCLLLRELVNSVLPGEVKERGMPIDAFRPVTSVSEQQDMALFEHHLIHTHLEVSA